MDNMNRLSINRVCETAIRTAKAVPCGITRNVPTAILGDWIAEKATRFDDDVSEYVANK